MYKIINGIAPNYLYEVIYSFFPVRHLNNLRSGFKNLCLPICKTVSYYYSFSPSTIKLWNYLSESVNNSPSLPVFKTKLKSTKVSTSCKYFNVGNRKKIFYIVNLKMMLPILMPT